MSSISDAASTALAVAVGCSSVDNKAASTRWSFLFPSPTIASSRTSSSESLSRLTRASRTSGESLLPRTPKPNVAQSRTSSSASCVSASKASIAIAISGSFPVRTQPRIGRLDSGVRDVQSQAEPRVGSRCVRGRGLRKPEATGLLPHEPLLRRRRTSAIASLFAQTIDPLHQIATSA